MYYNFPLCRIYVVADDPSRRASSSDVGTGERSDVVTLRVQIFFRVLLVSSFASSPAHDEITNKFISTLGLGGAFSINKPTHSLTHLPTYLPTYLPTHLPTVPVPFYSPRAYVDWLPPPLLVSQRPIDPICDRAQMMEP